MLRKLKKIVVAVCRTIIRELSEPTKVFPIEPDMTPDLRKQKEGDVGFNVKIRAITRIESADDVKKRKVHYIRETVWDLKSPPTCELRKLFSEQYGYDPCYQIPGTATWAFRLKPGLHSVPVAIGVCIQIPYGEAFEIRPRSSTIRSANRECVVEVINQSVPGDPGYNQGEPWAEICCRGPGDLYIVRGMELLQVFRPRCDDSVPSIVPSIDHMEKRDRHNGANGHTDHKK